MNSSRKKYGELKDKDWLKIHTKHCLEFRVSGSFLESKLPSVELLVEQFLISNDRNTENMQKAVIEMIVSKLSRFVLNKKIGLLVSGGEDSIFLLLVMVKILKIKPLLFCYRTKNNKRDVDRLRIISLDLGLELIIYDSSTLDMASEYFRFLQKVKRPPNDLAQPVHNALYFQATTIYNCEFVIDGQFCDTVLMSNPHNHFLFWYEKQKFFLTKAIKIANYFQRFFYRRLNKTASRLNILKNLVNQRKIEKIVLLLANIDGEKNKVSSYVKALINKCGSQMAFTILFYAILLDLRERDKYILCPKLISPFDDFNFAILSHFNYDKVMSYTVRKMPIREFCKQHYSSLFRFQNTLPFQI